MDTVITIIKTFLSFLLQLFEMFIQFLIGALNLILSFAQSIVELVV